ncbi:MAG: PAS domain S-box protein [Helicobacteraceae bacterium]|nr:PAS domain S-box protein [Helicobacteraceae bacterium]
MKAILVLFLSVLTLYGAPSFEEIFEKHTMAMLLIDPQSAEIVDANKAAIEFYGYEKKELLAKKITQINLFTSQQIQEEMQRAKQEKRNYFLFRHKLANGEIKRVEVRSVPFDFQGRVLLLSFVQDISQERFQQEDIWHYQKTLEETLEQKTQLIVVVFFVALLFLTLLFLLYRAKKKVLENKLVLSQKHFLENIVEGIHHAIIVTDTKGHIIRCNQKVYEMLGYTQEELLGKTPEIFHDKEQMQQRAQDLSRRLDKEVQVGIELFVLQSQASSKSVEEWNYITKDGEHLEVELSVSPLKNMDGVIEGYIGVATDISQTKANLEELESFFTVNLDLLCIATLDGVFLKTNKAWNDILGYDRDEIEGRKFLDFIHPEDIEKTLEAMSQLGQGKDVSEFMNRYRCHDGSYRYIEWRSHPKGDHIYAAARDITERKRVEDALREAKSAAEDALKAKSQFLANMSHEIRTPMNAIIGFGSLLEEMDLRADQKEMLHKMNSSSKILLKILNDILDYSKIEARKLELEQKCFAIADVISQLEVMFLESAKEKGIEFGCFLDKELPPQVIGDEFRLEQVLINLCSNAIKFTKKGEVKVSIELLEKLEDSFYRLRWSVQDSGIGMNKAQLARLFEPFMQADSSTTRQYGGTGLGLVICKNILEAMDSNLEIQTQEGKGTLFSFELKMKLCDEGERRSVDNTLSSQNTQTLQGLCILLVEDNEINQEVATMILESAGMQVDIASNGEEGVELFMQNQERYSAILMDLQMPVMSGYEATKKIREYDKEIPIIALTAAAMVEDKQKVLEAGMNDHLGKPIEKEDLYEVLKNHIDFSKAKQNPPLDLEPIKEKLRQGALLQQSVLEELYEKLQTRISNEALESFKEAIADFEYDVALAQIQKWKV